MFDTDIYPRYMAHQLRTQINATIVGKLIEINKKRDSLIIETDPEAKLNVEVMLNQHQELASFTVGRFYEVRGVCKSNKQLQLKSFTCYNADFDLASYNQMIQLATKQFKSIFYP